MFCSLSKQKGSLSCSRHPVYPHSSSQRLLLRALSKRKQLDLTATHFWTWDKSSSEWEWDGSPESRNDRGSGWWDTTKSLESVIPASEDKKHNTPFTYWRDWKMQCRRHSLRSQNKSPQMSLVAKPARFDQYSSIINTALPYMRIVICSCLCWAWGKGCKLLQQFTGETSLSKSLRLHKESLTYFHAICFFGRALLR